MASAWVRSGVQAVNNGMADGVGGKCDTLEYAAAEAGFPRYDVRVVRSKEAAQFLTRSAYLASDAPEREPVSVRYYAGEQGGFPNVLMPMLMLMLMLPPAVLEAALAEERAQTAEAVNTTNAT